MSFLILLMALQGAPTGSIQVLILDSLGVTPLARVSVSITRVEQGEMKGIVAHKMTDGSGLALFGDLEPGRYAVLASARRPGDRIYVTNSMIVQVEAGKTAPATMKFNPRGETFPAGPDDGMRNVRPDSVGRYRRPAMVTPAYPTIPPPDYPPARRHDSL